MTNRPKSSTMQDGEVQTGAVLDAMWEALKAECCKNPAEAKTIVFCGEEKFKKAMAPFAAAATAAPQDPKINGFRNLRPNWDSYGGRQIAPEAIDIALRIAPLLPDWQAVPRSDGGIQFERGDDEICIDIETAAPSKQRA